MDNCPVNRQYIKDAMIIFRLITSNLQVKTTRMGHEYINFEEITPMSGIILQRHSDVVLDRDVVKVNGIQFFVTYNRIIKLSTASEF